MATLILKLPAGDRRFKLAKSVTSIGRGPQNDVRIEDTSVEERHAHVLKDRNGFRIFATEGAKVSINGRWKSEWSLSDGDEVNLGAVTIIYHTSDVPSLTSPAHSPPSPTLSTSSASSTSSISSITNDESEGMAPKTTPSSMVSNGRSSPAPDDEAPGADGSASITESVPLEALKKLFRFSARISQSPTLDVLTRNLVDAVIELAQADTGFLLVTAEDGQFRLEVARDRSGHDLAQTDAKFSDSIVSSVIAHRTPVLLSDALADSLFSDSRSVINYRLRSVIAVPIVLEEKVLGVLYLACDQKPSAFSRHFLDILAVFAAQAGLLIKNAEVVTTLRRDNEALKSELDKRVFGEIVGGSSAMQGIFRTVSRIAPADISVLITGETGTGKELIAREIHQRSARAQGPFVAINMSAIPENLLEAELFGHIRGAFTGAISDRRGKFVDANKGTLFLDEIGDMPLALQGKLLRVLQDRVVEPVGSNTPVPIDIRVVSATNKDLAELQESGAFRPDLFYRLREVEIVLPPLRERGDDVVLLARYFLDKYAHQMGRRPRVFKPRCLAAMKRYEWRGNVRELEAKVKKAVVMCDGLEIDLEDMELEEGGFSKILPLREAKEAYALRYIREVLELNDGNRSKTARDLGIDPRTVYKYLEGK